MSTQYLKAILQTAAGQTRLGQAVMAFLEWQEALRRFRSAAHPQVQAAQRRYAQAAQGTNPRDLEALVGQVATQQTVRQMQQVHRYFRTDVDLLDFLGGALRGLSRLVDASTLSRRTRLGQGVGQLVTAALEFLGAVAGHQDVQRDILQLLRQTQLQPEMQEGLADLLRRQGYLVLRPEELPPAAAQALAEQLRRRGEVASQEITRTGLPFGIDPLTRRGERRKSVTLPFPGGRRRRFPVDHPIVTGQMVRTPQSSNVYSYGYDIENALLYVRFKAPGKKNASGSRPDRPGPLYQYRNVPPEVFLKLHEAASKGAAVWDLLRIRGTLSGHQYDYALVGITGNYVPRRATLTPQGEAFLRRQVQTLGGQWLESGLPDQLVRAFPTRPDRGSP